MTDHTRPEVSPDDLSTPSALRFWGVAELLYGGLITWLALTFIPKHPWLPGLVAGYGALSSLAGLALLGGQRAGWRLSLMLGGFAISLGVALCALTALAGFYWLSVFGVLGWGVAISSGLLISGLVQLLALYPCLKLRALLTEEVRRHFSRGGALSAWPQRAPYLAILLISTAGLTGWQLGRSAELPLLSGAQRDASLAYLRATLEGEHTPMANGAELLTPSTLSAQERREARDKLLKSLEGVPLGPQPLTVTLWAGGARLARVTGRGRDLAGALREVATSLKRHPKLSGRRLMGGRLVVDRALSLTPLPSAWGPLLSLSVDPGVDGLVSKVGGRTRTLLPSDLIEQQRFGVAPIVPGVPELRFGLDAKWVTERLGSEGLHKLKTEQWAEERSLQSPEERAALGDQYVPARLLLRGTFSPDPLPTSGSAQARLLKRRPRFLEAAHLAGDYITEHLNSDGRFDYQYFPYTDQVTQPKGAGYSLPRHSGAIYGLALLFEDQPKARYREAAERAIEWLRAQASPECNGWLKDGLCIPLSGRGHATLGNSALSALALLTYADKTGETKHLNFTEGLLRFILHMQRGDGDFFHDFELADGSYDPNQRSMFASEQAAFALVLAAKRWPNGPWLKAAERALDAMTGDKYERDFLSGFFYGADHWTCLAADSAWPQLQHRRYLDFCLGYSRFLQRLQYREAWGEGDASYDGHYGFGYLSPPQAPATGGFGEGVMASLSLAKHHGVKPSAIQDIYEQAGAGLEALVRDQITPHNSWPFKNQRRALGAFRRSVAESEVRVDFVQHSACSLIMSRRL